MAITLSAIAGQAVCNQSVVGRMIGTNMIADKDGTKIVEFSRISGYSFVDRQCTILGKLDSRADLDTLESSARNAKGGSPTIVIPGGNEVHQDLTTDESNTIWIGFNYGQRIASNLKDGYYLLKSYSSPVPPRRTDEFRFSLRAFWIGASL